jgi:hypothetical protein
MSKTKSEKRRQSRRHLFPGEGIKVSLKDDAEKYLFHGEANDLSPWGTAILITSQNTKSLLQQND